MPGSVAVNPSPDDRRIAQYDLLVVGGGINGTGIARDAAGRGMDVLLVEQHDLASHTSSASTKLLHGGLRYLQYYEFRLVREALQERERLLHIAPHISRPLQFVIPLRHGSRPAWMLRAGLWFYDRIGGRQTLPRSQAMGPDNLQWREGLIAGVRRGFAYWDAWVDDARLVVLNAVDAAERGATILTRTGLIGARAQGEMWLADLRASDGPDAAPMQVRARMIINAAGPWAGSLRGMLDGVDRDGEVRLVKGSHIVVPQLYRGEHACLLQQSDGRVVFTIPYQNAFTLIGTTELPAEANERARPHITAGEVDYLCAAVNGYFKREIAPDDVQWSYSGVRPLFDDGKADVTAISRDYVLHLDRTAGPPVLNVFGGKLTTYRRLAEHALAKAAPHLPHARGEWTATTPLPGGDLPAGGFVPFLAQVRQRWPFLPAAAADRMARAYGTRIEGVLAEATTWDDLGEDFGSWLTEAEARWLVRQEWAVSAEDILWRRTKLGLTCAPETALRLEAWLGTNVPAQSAGCHRGAG
ncbi:MAG: glycerol-3-phosphate dehydrogenase [Pseudomonadota bacterium]